MALIVEDGSIVEGANSYVARADLIAYALARGVVLADDDTTDVKAIKAMDYLESFRASFKGAEVEPLVQPLSFPRDGLTVGWTVVGNNVVPPAIKQAECQLVLEVNAGIILLPTKTPVAAQFVTKKQLGPIVTEYSEAVALAAQAAGVLPTIPQVAALLAPYLNSRGPTSAYRK